MLGSGGRAKREGEGGPGGRGPCVPQSCRVGRALGSWGGAQPPANCRWEAGPVDHAAEGAGSGSEAGLPPPRRRVFFSFFSFAGTRALLRDLDPPRVHAHPRSPLTVPPASDHPPRPPLPAGPQKGRPRRRPGHDDHRNHAPGRGHPFSVSHRALGRRGVRPRQGPGLRRLGGFRQGLLLLPACDGGPDDMLPAGPGVRVGGRPERLLRPPPRWRPGVGRRPPPRPDLPRRQPGGGGRHQCRGRRGWRGGGDGGGGARRGGRGARGRRGAQPPRPAVRRRPRQRGDGRGALLRGRHRERHWGVPPRAAACDLHRRDAPSEERWEKRGAPQNHVRARDGGHYKKK